MHWDGLMSDEGTPLERLADLTVGHVGPMADQYVENGIPFLRSQNVKPFRLDLSDVKYIPTEFHRRLSKSALGPGDVVVVRTGAPGTAAMIPDDLGVANCADLVVIRPGPSLDSRYLCYFINGAARAYVASRTVGAVQQHFNVGAARELLIPNVSISEQCAIAEVLGALDDKIEANCRLITVCDATWTAAAVGVAAEGRTAPLSSLARFINGRAYTKDATGTGRMVVRIAELNSGPGGSTVYNDLSVPEENIALPGDLLFAWSGSLTVHRWFRPEAIINQHIFKAVPNPGVPMWFLHASILHLLDHFRGIAADKATTMGHIQRHHLDEPVPVASDERLAEWDRWAGPVWRRALAAEVENLALADLRDALLPGLLSGEIRIRAAEELAG
jgi:type I restriction enzyme, S subunit